MISKLANEIMDEAAALAAFPASAVGTMAIGAIPLTAAQKAADFYRKSRANELRLNTALDPVTRMASFRQGGVEHGIFPESWGRANTKALPALTALWAASRLTDKDEVPSAMSQGLALAALGSAAIGADAAHRDYARAKSLKEIAWRPSTQRAVDRLAAANALRYAPAAAAAVAAPFVLSKAYAPWAVRKNHDIEDSQRSAQ